MAEDEAATTTGRSGGTPNGGPAQRPRASRRRARTDGATAGIAEDGASLEAERVDLRGSAVGRVDASELTVAMGAVGAARADSVSVDKGAVGAVMSDRVDVSRGYARSILARQVQLDRAAARIIVAADVRAERTAVMFLVARRVSGDVRVLFDWRGALAFGAVVGVVLGVLRRRRPS
jgi:hypothetical protein